jgi:hypothetical protein
MIMHCFCINTMPRMVTRSMNSKVHYYLDYEKKEKEKDEAVIIHCKNNACHQLFITAILFIFTSTLYAYCVVIYLYVIQNKIKMG